MTGGSWRAGAVRIAAAGLLAVFSGGCDELIGSMVTVRVRNEAADQLPIYLCTPEEQVLLCGGINNDDMPPPDRTLLNYGGVRSIQVEYREGSLDGTFAAVRQVDFGDGPRWTNQSVAICRSTKTIATLRENTPEVIWTGSQISCPGW